MLHRQVPNSPDGSLPEQLTSAQRCQRHLVWGFDKQQRRSNLQVSFMFVSAVLVLLNKTSNLFPTHRAALALRVGLRFCFVDLGGWALSPPIYLVCTRHWKARFLSLHVCTLGSPQYLVPDNAGFFIGEEFKPQQLCLLPTGCCQVNTLR